MSETARGQSADRSAQRPADLSGARIFALREAIARAGEAFAEFRSGTGVGAATPPWDAVVLTCATESQAVAAREELGRRQALGLFPARCLLLALADPPPGRVGSGGATLLALAALGARWADAGPGPDAAFAGRRVLLIHSGGESQRLPAYAALGKIFAPLPVLLPQAAGSAIFDWLYLLVSAMPGGPGEVVLLAGDVLPVFNPVRLPPLAATPFQVRGVGQPVPASLGQRFGVYVPGADGSARRILQKPTLAALRAAGAVANSGPPGEVIVDTGIVTLGPAAVGRLLDPGETRLRTVPWDLYRDWLPCLAGEPGALPAGEVPAALARISQGLTAGVAVPPDGLFVHLGTTRDFHDAVVGNTPLRRLFPFTSQRESAAESGAEVSGAFAGRSLLSRLTRLGRGAVVDHCRAGGVLDVGPDGMASGVEVPQGETLRVGAGRLCYQTLVVTPDGPGGGTRVTVVLALDDNPKLALDDNPKLALDADAAGAGTSADDPRGNPSQVAAGGHPTLTGVDERATLNGQPLGEWLTTRQVAPEDLWPAGAGHGPRTLWEAKLFVADADDPYRRILTWLQQPPAAPAAGEGLTALGLPGVDRRWRETRRYSLRDLLDRSDAAALAAWRGALVGDVVAARVVGDVTAGGDEDFAGLFSSLTAAQREEASGRLLALAADPQTTPDALHRARYWRILADLVAPPLNVPGAPGTPSGVEEYHDRASAAVREAVSRPPASRGTRLSLLTERRVRVVAPVRIDFGGGWTDTPPFSLERGGAVVNAAIALEGELPIWAEVEVTSSPGIVLESEDIGATVTVTTRADVAGYCQPNDPFALVKACLVLGGVLDPTDDAPLTRLPAGRGLCVRTGCRIPRGSGLGTSSVLGAAVLRALGQVLGRPQDDAELSRQTLELEQLMTTGGGWQDQMGAIAPGIKLVTTAPGLEQRPRVDVIPLAPEARATIEAHLVVAYTGHHRLAKHILREVVMRYLGRDPLAMQALYQLRGVAGQLARAIAALDLERFGTLVNQAWLLNKTLDPQTSYPAIERLFSALAPHVYGAKLVGAGGGGFLLAVTRQPDQGELVADLMARDREFAYGYVVPHRLWDGGLQVSVEE